MSTAFWDALWAGLACPTQLYAFRRDEKYTQVGRVDTAWNKVGSYVYGSIDTLADNVGDREGNKRAK